MKSLPAVLTALLTFAVLACQPPRAWADTKSEMVVLLDKLGENTADVESLVDWENLVVKTPQTKNMDIPKMYRGMDAANQKNFRQSFLKSFSSSFKQSSGGHKFKEIADVKGALSVADTPPHPTMTLHQKGGKPDLKLLFTRKGKKLLFQGMETK